MSTSEVFPPRENQSRVDHFSDRRATFSRPFFFLLISRWHALFSFSMTFIDWLVLIAIVYYLFKVLVDWATASGAAAAAVNNQHHQQQQQQQNLHQQPGPSGVGGGTSHQQNFLLKPRNNRTPGEGTCYEIGESSGCSGRFLTRRTRNMPKLLGTINVIRG